MEAAKANSNETLGDYRGDFRAKEDQYHPGTSVVPPRNQGGNSEIDSSALAKLGLGSSLEGLEDFYHPGSTLEVENDHPGSTLEPVLSLKEAVEFYKISEKTIRLHITQGKIPACKENGPRGPEWRIYPGGLPADKEAIQVVEQEKEHDHPGTTLEVGQAFPAFQQIDKLLDVIKAQSEKLEDANKRLESANYRIGYLEAQTQNYQEQVKLLTDSQHKSGWWHRFCSWFVGR